MTNSFEFRAAPRRRKDVSGEQPLFLRKAFNMISACPPEIGAWSPSGETFIIKDVGRFAEEIIPTVYKHNKFSSFVRQLNFYGFRKIRSDAILHNSSWWEFRHPLFQKDKPELLAGIKKSIHFDESSGSVVQPSREMRDIQDEMSAMFDRLMRLDNAVTQLTETVAHLTEQKQQQQQQLLGQSMTTPVTAAPESREEPRKRRMFTVPFNSDAQSSYSADAMDLLDEPMTRFEDDDTFEKLDNLFRYDDVLAAEPSQAMNYSDSELLLEDVAGDYSESLSTVSNGKSAEASIDVMANRVAASDESVTNIIQCLPQELRLRFIDRLAEVVGNKLADQLNSQSSKIHSNMVAAQTNDSSVVVKKEALPMSFGPVITPQQMQQQQSVQRVETIQPSFPPAAMVSNLPPSIPPKASLHRNLSTTSNISVNSVDSRCPCFYCREGAEPHTPAIAYPLASAAIGALFASSMGGRPTGITGPRTVSQSEEYALPCAAPTSQGPPHHLFPTAFGGIATGGGGEAGFGGMFTDVKHQLHSTGMTGIQTLEIAGTDRRKVILTK